MPVRVVVVVKDGPDVQFLGEASFLWTAHPRRGGARRRDNGDAANGRTKPYRDRPRPVRMANRARCRVATQRVSIGNARRRSGIVYR